jgi:soluble lytic murein transglycosylase-like protein
MIENELEARAGIAELLAAESGALGAAWEHYYRYKDRAEEGTPRAYGIKAIKRELVYRGFGEGLNVDTPFFGGAAQTATKRFQKSLGLAETGVVNPETARRLFKKRIWAASHNEGVPALYLCKQLNLESGFDPAAVGYVDARDRGLAQINSYWHPTVTDDKAFDPSFSIPWAANYFSENFKALNDVDAALAAHNVGRFYAREWLKQGKPPSGLYTLEGKDYAAIITRYVKLVKTREC